MSKPLIYITRKLPQHLLKPYENQFKFRMYSSDQTPIPRETLLQEVKNVDGLLCMLTEQIDEELMTHARHLKIVANLAVGYDNINVQAARKHHVIVTNTPDVLTETTVDLTFTLLLATARRLIEANRLIQDDQWKHWSPFLLAGTDVYKQTIGIVGMGRIGEAVARRAKGFGMNILYHNRTRKFEAEDELNVVYASFDELIKQADFIVSLVPLSQETKHLFNASTFKKMKSSAIFINVSRGQIVDEEALYKALESGEIAAAGLDVFKDEPISSNHPLMQLNNVICLPHIGSASRQTRENMINLCLKNLQSFFTKGEVLTPINA